jgi:hypothetical protein
MWIERFFHWRPATRETRSYDLRPYLSDPSWVQIEVSKLQIGVPFWPSPSVPIIDVRIDLPGLGTYITGLGSSIRIVTSGWGMVRIPGSWLIDNVVTLNSNADYSGATWGIFVSVGVVRGFSAPFAAANHLLLGGPQTNYILMDVRLPVTLRASLATKNIYTANTSTLTLRTEYLDVSGTLQASDAASVTSSDMNLAYLNDVPAGTWSMVRVTQSNVAIHMITYKEAPS